MRPRTRLTRLLPTFAAFAWLSVAAGCEDDTPRTLTAEQRAAHAEAYKKQQEKIQESLRERRR